MTKINYSTEQEIFGVEKFGDVIGRNNTDAMVDQISYFLNKSNK